MGVLPRPSLAPDSIDDAFTPPKDTPAGTGCVYGDVRGQAEEDALDAINEIAAEEEDFASVLDDDSDREDSAGLPVSRLTRLRPIAVELPTSTLIWPRSICDDFVPPVEHFREWQAVENLLRADSSQQQEDFIEFELDRFSCYVITPQYDSEMRALHSHATFTGKGTFYFDGILRAGAVKCFVRRVPFDEIPLGNYGQEEPTVGDQMWIRSTHNSRREIYYKLTSPSLEYARYHDKFVWVADLAKHVVDYCGHLLEQGRSVSIQAFKTDFSTWLQATHQRHVSFQKWYEKRAADDFRQSIVANSAFLRKEIWGTLPPKKLRRISIFQEISNPFGAIPVQVPFPSASEYPKTIVTPYIYSCFSHMEAGAILKSVEPTIGEDERTRKSWPQSHSRQSFTQQGISGTGQNVIDRIRPGHLISTPPDEEESGSKWKTKKINKKWYGLVQRISVNKKGERRFDVTWLYEPEDTPCCSMTYPWENELFLSNHCTCGQSVKVRQDQVLGVHSVEWHGGPGTQAEFFVRQTYLSDDRRFVTLEQSATRQCDHRHAASQEYSTGDTVLVKLPQREYLEPCELLGYLDHKTDHVRLRRFKRRSEFSSGCPPNELIYTESEVCCKTSAIVTSCIIRCYSPTDSVPVPYNQRGVGNAFYVTHRLLESGRLEPWSLHDGEQWPSFRQGFDPTKKVKKLRALDLFSGFGNFGRGLEDGGAIEAKWANDIWDVAVHTYKINSRNAKSMNPFHGSIDDLLRLAMEGKFSSSVPRPDEVDVILGGSPCQGFSLITVNKDTDRQKKNRSMVASFASTVDFWRPQWGILENVRSIVKSSRDVTEDCFSQLICALVGMGYQTQIVLGDAWSYGAPQGRVRVFLCFAAPGLRLPQPPYPSHSSPRDRSSGRLGKMTNGEAYVERENRFTAFKYVTAAEATADLPDIHDSHPGTCIPFPDHRLSISITTGEKRQYSGRPQIRSIPLGPYGSNFSKAYYGRGKKSRNTPPDMFPHEAQMFPMHTYRAKEISNAWGRQHPNQLFPTITTSCQWQDARTGGSLLHWSQPRPLTVMEVRRAQGVPDDEVLCGKPSQQWKLVGNAVARQVSIALGLKLREAWAGTLYEDGVSNVVVTESAVPAAPAASVHDERADVRDVEPDHEVYITIDSDDDDDHDDHDDDYIVGINGNIDGMSLGGLTSQADAGPSSSTRATSFVEVLQDEPQRGADVAFSVGLQNGVKRALSSTGFASFMPHPASSSSLSPLKKQCVMIEISDDDDDDEDEENGLQEIMATTELEASPVPQSMPNGPTIVRLSSEESY